jgi:hypothetical protein
MQDIYCNEHGVKSFVCIYSDNDVYTKFLKVREIIDLSGDESWRNCVVKLTNWEVINTFICEICTPSNVNGTKVPTTNGLSYTIKTQVIENFAQCGIEVVGINQCENLSPEIAEESLIEYLRGNATWPSWSAFYFSDWSNNPMPNHLKSVIIRRKVVDKILNDIKAIAKMPKKNVALKKLIHQPGAGASTVAMHVMWELRSSFKCVRIDADCFIKDPESQNERMNIIAGNIILLRSFGESDSCVAGLSICKPIFILLDNANEKTAKALRQNLEDIVNARGIKYCTTQFIILYLEQKVDVSHKTEVCDQLDLIIIKQELDKSEIQLFDKKLNELKNEGEVVAPAEMLEFVIMAHNFQDCEYVTGVVRDALRTTKEYRPLQTNLLLYLSVLKYFMNLSLPANICKSILDEQTDFEGRNKNSNAVPTVSVLTSLCPEAKLFISEKNRVYACYHADGKKIKTKTLEITHAPVARQIYLNLAEKRKLSTILEDFLDEPSILSGYDYYDEMMHNQVRKLFGNYEFFNIASINRRFFVYIVNLITENFSFDFNDI